VIECKTQLGRTRKTWLQRFEKQEALLKTQRPRTKLFLLAMTKANWGGFGDDPRRGKQFFALLDKRHFTTSVKPSPAPIKGLLDPIENLFRLILAAY
jgi:hypothetical protein